MERVHELKTIPPFFEDVISEHKTFEVRWGGDRDFRLGDLLLLREYESNPGIYTDRAAVVRVTYLCRFQEPRGYLGMGIKLLVVGPYQDMWSHPILKDCKVLRP